MTIVHEIYQFSQQKKGAVTPGNPLHFLPHILLIMHGNHFLFVFDKKERREVELEISVNTLLKRNTDLTLVNNSCQSS